MARKLAINRRPTIINDLGELKNGVNEIKISSPKTSLINNIWNPHNSPSKHMLEIADSGMNIHLAKKATTTIDPVIISNYMTARLPYGNTI